LPPRAEQTRIVAKLEELLSDLDAGVAELKAAQKKLAQYRQSLLKAAVEGALTVEWRAKNTPSETGAQLLERILKERRARWEAKQLAKYAAQGKTPPKDWQKKYPEPIQPDTTGLPELPEGWVWASVDQLSESVRNGLSKTPNTAKRGFPIFKINAVRPMFVNFAAIKHIEIDESEAADYWVEVGDVLATRYNGSVDLLGVFGMVREVPKRTLHPDKLIRMKPVTGEMLGAWMEICGNVGFSRKHLVSRVKTTAGQTGISGEDLKKTPIPLAPVTEQKLILSILDERIEAIKELEQPTEQAIQQSAAQRQNILRAAFSGQLVPQDPNDEPASRLLERIRAERAAQSKAAKPRRHKTAARIQE
jgi:type I restriction enzyme S subunit